MFFNRQIYPTHLKKPSSDEVFLKKNQSSASSYRLGILLILVLVFWCPNFSFAAISDWHKNHSDTSETRLVASFYEENSSKKLIAGLQFKIAPGWKIYGEGSEGIGMPPSFNFSGSKNYANHVISWPKPEYHEERIGNEIFAYSSYHNAVVIPLAIDLQKDGSPTELTLSVDYSLCNDICIPAHERFSLKISDKIDTEALKEIQKFYPQKITGDSTTSEDSTINKLPLITYFFFALLGGLILNVMPCVLPVLSIKLLSIIDHRKAPISHIRFAFFATTIGILFCFVTLTLLACLIKFTGNELGWGLQFQNPYFLIFLILITVFFTANLLGKFEITFEQVLATFLNKKISESEKKKNIFVPNFLSGILATLLATPCSAPFLGSAISFALVQNFTTIFMIFFFIGVGFSLPYIVLFFAPRLVYSLPKPGMWMVKFKQLLSLFMVATLLWLLHILSSNLDLTTTTLLMISIAGIFFGTKIHDKFLKYAVVGLLLCVTFALPNSFKKQHHEMTNGEIRMFWQDFNEEELYRQVSLGRVVLVDITADWCITCKFNKIHVLQDKEIEKMISNGDFVAIRGDITKPNLKIMEFMRKHDRFAIPFNAIYGPNAVDGKLTSELLNKDELLQLIEQAK